MAEGDLLTDLLGDLLTDLLGDLLTDLLGDRERRGWLGSLFF